MSFGSSNTSTTQQQQSSSTTNPYAPTVPALQSLIGQLKGLTTNAGGLTDAQSTAISNIEANSGNPWASQIAGAADNVFKSQAPVASDAYSTLQKQLTPTADGSMLDLSNNPEVQKLLETIRGDVSNSVNGQFAAAGRDMSGMNQQSLARGISQGEAAPLLNLYSQERQNQLGAASTLFNGGQTTAGNVASLNQQAGEGGAKLADAAVAANLQGDQGVLAAEALKLGIPTSQLQQIASILFPAAQLGKTTDSTGTGTSSSDSSSWGITGKDIGSGLSGIAAIMPFL